VASLKRTIYTDLFAVVDKILGVIIVSQRRQVFIRKMFDFGGPHYKRIQERICGE